MHVLYTCVDVIYMCAKGGGFVCVCVSRLRSLPEEPRRTADAKIHLIIRDKTAAMVNCI